MAARDGAPDHYDPLLQTAHWATLALIAGLYTLAWVARSGLAGEYSRSVMQMHRSLGLTVAALTLIRLAWRSRARIPRLPGDLPVVQKLAARATEALLYALLLLQPLIGLVRTNAGGQRVDLYFLGELPPIVAPDKALARLASELHGLTAEVLLAVIALHAAAALFHHFIRRDTVLTAMLPARLRGCAGYRSSGQASSTRRR